MKTNHMKIIFFLIILFLLSLIPSCSTFFNSNDAEQKFELCNIPGGEYILLRSDQDIEYRSKVETYKVLKNKVTNVQYLTFLNEIKLKYESDNSDTAQIRFYENSVEGLFGIDSLTYEFLFHYGSNLEYREIIDLDNQECGIKFVDGDFELTHDSLALKPVKAVTWYGAYSFAKYYDCELPTLSQYQKAYWGNDEYYVHQFNKNIDSLKAETISFFGVRNLDTGLREWVKEDGDRNFYGQEELLRIDKIRISSEFPRRITGRPNTSTSGNFEPGYGYADMGFRIVKR